MRVWRLSLRRAISAIISWVGSFSFCLSYSWMDGWVRVLRPFNSISVISRGWKDEHERLCAMKRHLGSGRISPPAGFKPATPWSKVGSADRSARRTLPYSWWSGMFYCDPSLEELTFCRSWWQPALYLSCTAYRDKNPSVCLAGFVSLSPGPWSMSLTIDMFRCPLVT